MKFLKLKPITNKTIYIVILIIACFVWVPSATWIVDNSGLRKGNVEQIEFARQIGKGCVFLVAASIAAWFTHKFCNLIDNFRIKKDL